MIRCYCRVSTISQAESGHGIDSQKDACIAYCGTNPYKVYSDEGISGGSHIVARPAMMELLREFQRGDVLLVTQRDRLGRDTMIVAILEKTIEEKGGTVVSLAGEGTESDSPTDILIRRVVDAISEYVRLNGKLRVKAALRAKKRRGERTGGIPYGYRLAVDGVHLEVDDNEQGVIHLVNFLRGKNLSFYKISQNLFDRKIVSRNGKPFLAKQVQRMLNYQPGGEA